MTKVSFTVGKAVVLLLLFAGSLHAQKNRIVSRIDSSASPELVLVQEFTVKAPVEAVWKAYTTAEGWKGWAVPVAEIDFKVGGTIRTNYNPEGTPYDSTAILNHIVNYVPERVLTLQAELTKHFPEFMKKDSEDFYNVIFMQPVGKNKTHVVSYGIGYKNEPKYMELMKFFIQGNESSYKKLIAYLEKN